MSAPCDDRASSLQRRRADRGQRSDAQERIHHDRVAPRWRRRTRTVGGDSIYNSADDNASGSAGNLSIAELMHAGAAAEAVADLHLGQRRGAAAVGHATFRQQSAGAARPDRRAHQHRHDRRQQGARIAGCAEPRTTGPNEVFLIGPRVLSAQADALIERRQQRLPEDEIEPGQRSGRQRVLLPAHRRRAVSRARDSDDRLHHGRSTTAITCRPTRPASSIRRRWKRRRARSSCRPGCWRTRRSACASTVRFRPRCSAINRSQPVNPVVNHRVNLRPEPSS